MGLFEKMKQNVSGVVDDVTSTAKPAFIKEVLEIGEELKKYQHLVANVEKSYEEGKIDKTEYDLLKSDHMNRIDSLKSKIMSWKKEYLDLKGSLTEELKELQSEKTAADIDLEKVEKHYSLQLITEEDYLGRKKNSLQLLNGHLLALRKKRSYMMR